MQKKHTSSNKVQGSIFLSSRGNGYVEKEGWKEDIEIANDDLNTALHGDIVEVLARTKKGHRPTGVVTKIIERAKSGFTGVLHKDKSGFFVKADDIKMYTYINVPKQNSGGAKEGQKVFVEILSWKQGDESPLGKIVTILGKAGENNAEMHAIALEKGFAEKIPDKIEQEAKKIKAKGIREEDLRNRKDFRKTLTFTIDPIDAKDFDDAISFKDLGNDTYEVGIHIADVSHYVLEGSEIDKEAKKRGTSVYLVDRTIPMLPEVLSNDLCSLVPKQDRLTMSAVFVMDKHAKVKSEWFGKSVIHSQKRFTYEEAEKALTEPSAPLHKELTILNTIAKKLTSERFRQGAISLDQDEVKFVLDENGKPLKVIKKERGDSNRLIEELMLLANRKVAELFAPKNKKDEGHVFVYRIHDLPSEEKMVDLQYFLKGIGHKVNLRNGVIPNNDINSLLEKLADTGSDTVHRAVIRSMAKAIYSTKNIGHYGLAFKHYTHFTSPIRRYPDIIVHRMLMSYLEGKKINPDKLQTYEVMARKASEQEKKASDAERASIKYKQVEYMSARVGQTFSGVISGVTEWGMYVEEVETKCEGMVSLRSLKDDFYVFNEKNLEIVGQKKKKRYRLGDKVKVKVKSTDLERKTIDYELA